MRASSGCRAAPFRIWTARLWPSHCWPVRDLITSHQRLACRPLALAAQSRTQPRAIASVHLDHGTKNGLIAWPSVCRSRFSPSILARFASGTRAGPNGDGGREARDSDSGGGEEGGVNKKPSNGRREALLTVPNVLTFARLAMTPLIGHLIVTQQWNNALGLVFVAGLTDWLDGFIARRFPSQATVIGGVVDPISDKALVMTVTLCLAASGAIPWWLSAAIVTRDVGLLGCSLYIRHVSLRAHFEDVTWQRYWDFGYPSVVVSPTELSKVNTVLQVFTLLCSIAAPAAGWVGEPHTALLALWIATTATTLASGAGYAFSNEALVFIRPSDERLLDRLPMWAQRRLERKSE